MIALINIEQYRQLKKFEFAPDSFCNPTISDTGEIFISEEEISQFTDPAFDWVHDLPLIEISSLSNPDTTPPASNGYGIEIPSQYHWAFPIRLNGFVVELKDKQGTKYCEVSGLSWSEFVTEFDKPQNNDYRLSVLPIWQYAMTQAANNNFIVL